MYETEAANALLLFWDRLREFVQVMIGYALEDASAPANDRFWVSPAGYAEGVAAAAKLVEHRDLHASDRAMFLMAYERFAVLCERCGAPPNKIDMSTLGPPSIDDPNLLALRGLVIAHLPTPPIEAAPAAAPAVAAVARDPSKGKPPPPPTDRMRINRASRPPTITLDDNAYPVENEGAAFVAILLDKHATLVEPETFDAEPTLKGQRRDRIKEKLPKEVRRLIHGKPGGGYRLTLA